MGKSFPKALSLLRCPFEVRWHDGEGFSAKMPDDEWLNIIGEKKWIVCSHDAKWQTEPAALKAIQQHKIGCFYLYGANSLGFFKMKSLAHNYDQIVKICAENKRPFIYRVTASNRLKKLI
jgi:PIN like domain